LAFIQELTESVSTVSNSLLVITLPSSILEHYDYNAEKLYRQLLHITGRIEKIETPVEESEISDVIRRRLFSSVNENEAKKVIDEFIRYSEHEDILPKEFEVSEYRKKFISSYPFMPEVIDILYDRWGSFPNFQRTRGVLRLLSLVIYDLKNKNIPYISLADIDLSNQEIRQELIKHIGTEYNSVIAQDITDFDAGCKKADNNLGVSYKGLKIASRVGTTIFMCSFSAGIEKVITLNEIKRIATTLDNPSSVVAEAVEQLKDKLFYFQKNLDKYFFLNHPNINRIILDRMENIKDEEVYITEKNLLKEMIKGGNLKVYLWETEPANIQDNQDLKLVIIRKEDKNTIENLMKKVGSSPRVNNNVVFVLYPDETKRNIFNNSIKKLKSLELILKDETLNLSNEQKKDLNKKYEEISEQTKDLLRGL